MRRVILRAGVLLLCMLAWIAALHARLGSGEACTLLSLASAVILL